MPGRSYRLTRIAGIPIGVSPLWLIIVALITWGLGDSYYPSAVSGIAPATSYALGLASALLLFASILAHELGHALVARRHGVEIEEIDLWLLGGVARMSGRPRRAEDELRFALAGPMVTALVALAFGIPALVLPHSTPALVRAVIDYQAEVNLLILGFNLVPAFPLDGGRVARALMWRRSGDIAQATERAAWLGRWFGYLLIAGGALLTLQGAAGGLWLVLVGFFLVAAAGLERTHEHIVASLTGVPAHELMSVPVVCIPQGTSVQSAQRYFATYRYTAFPVVDHRGVAVGLFSIDQLKRERLRNPETLVDELMHRDAELLADEQTDIAQLVERAAFQRVGRAAVLDRSHRPVGLISITDIGRAVRADRPRNPPIARRNTRVSHT